MLENFINLIISFGKIGTISLGGGNSMLKLLEYEAVSHRHWIAEAEFIQMVGSTFLFPGLTAVKLSALIGYKVGGFIGLILAVVSLNLPGLILALLGFELLNQYKTTPVLNKVMITVQYGALALLAAATFSIAQGVFKLYLSPTIAICSFLFFLGLVYFDLSPFWGFIVFIVICSFLVA